MFKIMKGGEVSLESVVSENTEDPPVRSEGVPWDEKGHNPAAPAAVRVPCDLGAGEVHRPITLCVLL